MIHEFWRTIYLAPVVVGRDELIIAQQGILTAAMLLGRVFALASGQDVASGVKRLEIFLRTEQSMRLRNAVRGPFEDFASIARANSGLIDIMRAEGPNIAALFGFPYPKNFEAAVLAYLRKELSGFWVYPE